MITVIWETKSEIVKRLLPPPLKPVKKPIVISFIVNYPSTNQGQPYLESALMLRSEFNGELGNYYLAMHVTDDRSAFAGREIFGFPKKMANIKLNRVGKNIEAFNERLGTKTIEIKANLTGKFNDPETPNIIKEFGLLPGRKKNTVNYNFKFFPAANKVGFDYNPRLVKQETAVRPISMEMGEVKIALNSTEHDPWGEIEIEKVLGGLYIRTDNTMLPGKVVAEVNSDEFLPYSYLKWDWY